MYNEEKREGENGSEEILCGEEPTCGFDELGDGFEQDLIVEDSGKVQGPGFHRRPVEGGAVDVPGWAGEEEPCPNWGVPSTQPKAVIPACSEPPPRFFASLKGRTWSARATHLRLSTGAIGGSTLARENACPVIPRSASPVDPGFYAEAKRIHLSGDTPCEFATHTSLRIQRNAPTDFWHFPDDYNLPNTSRTSSLVLFKIFFKLRPHMPALYYSRLLFTILRHPVYLELFNTSEFLQFNFRLYGYSFELCSTFSRHRSSTNAYSTVADCPRRESIYIWNFYSSFKLANYRSYNLRLYGLRCVALSSL
ncbi:hypothetical protein C8J57DRAFT_1218749 [Mycena rebaudengoi]|nr:hypothetical protein C8J57DRAFT_1218749 [Mycena rebaudengoi]